MLTAGSVIALATGFLYSLRYSFVKDLKKFGISKLQVNFFYRLISLPVLFIAAIVLKSRLIDLSADFLIWLLMAVTMNVVWGVYQVYIYQKSQFSAIESLLFLNILFSTLAGVIVFGETLSLNKTGGILLIVMSFIILWFKDIADMYKNRLMFQIVAFYLLTTLVDVSNKKAIMMSSPVTFAVWISILLAGLFYVLSKVMKQRVSKFTRKGGGELLAAIGILSGMTVLGISYAYQLLPLGIVVTLISTRVFFSLWLSKTKYSEVNLVPNIIASIIALAGIGVIFA